MTFCTESRGVRPPRRRSAPDRGATDKRARLKRLTDRRRVVSAPHGEAVGMASAGTFAHGKTSRGPIYRVTYGLAAGERPPQSGSGGLACAGKLCASQTLAGAKLETTSWKGVCYGETKHDSIANQFCNGSGPAHCAEQIACRQSGAGDAFGQRFHDAGSHGADAHGGSASFTRRSGRVDHERASAFSFR